MNRIGKVFANAVRIASAIAFAVAGACMVAMMVHIFLDVLLRGLFNKPLTGTLEIVSSYYMVAVSFLPLAALELSRDMVFVEVFTARMSAEWRRAMDAFARLLALGAMTLIAVSAAKYAWKQTLRGEFMDVVFFDLLIWPTRWIAAIGFALAALAALVVLVWTLRGRLDETGAHHDGTGHGTID